MPRDASRAARLLPFLAIRSPESTAEQKGTSEPLPVGIRSGTGCKRKSPFNRLHTHGSWDVKKQGRRRTPPSRRSAESLLWPSGKKAWESLKPHATLVHPHALRTPA